MKRRVVVTGLGVVAPTGIGKEAFWTALCEGRSGVGRLTRFAMPDLPCQAVAEVRDFDPSRYMDPRHARRMDAVDHYAVAAARLAVDDAGLAVMPGNRSRIGIALGTALYGVRFGEQQHAAYRAGGIGSISPYTAIAIIPCSPMGFVSIALGVTGWSHVVASCAASGVDAIGCAREAIEADQADAVIAGGAEAPLAPSILRGLAADGALSRAPVDRDSRASRPFDRGRDGFVLGEGCGLVVLEGEDHARARGARIYAEVLGYGSATGPFDSGALRVDRGTAREAVRMALDDASCTVNRVHLVASSASSEVENDRVESELVREQYGGEEPPVTSIQSMIGQCLGAMGGIQAVASVLAIARGYIPPTINYAEPDPACPMATLVTTGRPAEIRRVVQHGFGYLATQAALVWGAVGP